MKFTRSYVHFIMNPTKTNTASNLKRKGRKLTIKDFFYGLENKAIFDHQLRGDVENRHSIALGLKSKKTSGVRGEKEKVQSSS